MEEGYEKKQKFFGKNFTTIIGLLISAGVLSGIWWCYQQYMEPPIIQCEPEADCMTFSIDQDMRGININLYPQIIIEYDKANILNITLDGYYETNFLIFDPEGKNCSTKLIAEEKADSFVRYLKDTLVSKLYQLGPEESAETIDQKLNVYISTIGGVTYENNRSNTPKQYCIIERNGIVVDIDQDSDFIEKRLYQMIVDINREMTVLEQDDQVIQIIETLPRTILQNVSRVKWSWLESFAGKMLVGIIFWTAVVFGIIRASHFLRKRIKDRKRRKKLNRALRRATVPVLIVISILNVITVSASMTRPENQIFIQTPIASQMKPEALFEKHLDKKPEKTKLESDFDSWLEKLHIESRYTGAELSAEMLAFYQDLLEPYYQEGDQQSPEPDLSEDESEMIQKIRDKAAMTLSRTVSDFDQEYQEWAYVYEKAKDLKALYQSSRAIGDAFMEDENPSWKNLFYRASEAVSRGEEFLRFADRSITYKADSKIIYGSDIAFVNGKIYYRLSELAGSFGETGKSYRNSMMALSRACMNIALKTTDRENKRYAVLCYYLGNMDEKIVKALPENSPITEKMIREGLYYYREAQTVLEEGKTSYDEEENMRVNIRAGIATLIDLSD